MSDFVKQLSSSLFWDVDISEIDDEENKRFIIQRVLEMKEELTMIGYSSTKSIPYKE